MPLLPALVAALIQLTGSPLSGGIISGSASIRLERASGGDTPVLTLNSPSGVVRLLVDSGASSTMVTPALTRRLRLPSRALSSREIELAGGGTGCASLHPRRTRLPTLNLAGGEQQGQLRLSGLEALVLPVAALPDGVDGVLGAPSLRQLPLWIDPQRNRLALGIAALQAAQADDSPLASFRVPVSRFRDAQGSERRLPAAWPSGSQGQGAAIDGPPGPRLDGRLEEASAKAPGRSSLVIPLRWYRGVPLLALQSPVGPVQALADSGAEGLFIRPELAARLRPLGPAQTLRLTGFCGEQTAELRRYTGFSLGKLSLGDLPLGQLSVGSLSVAVEAIRIDNPIFAQLGVEAIVGQELLRSHRQLWRLDRQPPRLELR